MASSSTNRDANTFPHDPGTASLFGDKASLLIKCNQRLQKSGIPDTIRLPQIIVIGDQSAGNSSLIEALSTIKVPKASGLCTKCPIAIDLHGGIGPLVPWRCTISLEENYSYNAKKTGTTARRPLGPWEARPTPQTFEVGTFDDPMIITDKISQAQKLLLHPNRSANDLAQLQASAERSEVPFSPNLVRVDVWAKGFYDLSLIDMPGTTAAADEGQEPYVVELVQNLTAKYATNKNNVILLTLHLNTDFATSTACGLIQKHKLQSRIIRVFTKVDIAQVTDRNRCLHMYFLDQAYTVGHGQHMVMLNPAKDENTFFQQQPWATFPASVHAYFGVPKLLHRMREVLFVQTHATLPSNLSSIHARLDTLKKLLRDYPAPQKPAQNATRLQVLFSKFEDQSKHIFADRSARRNELQQAMKSFGDILDDTEPTCNFMTEEEIQDLIAAWKDSKIKPDLQNDITKSTLQYTYEDTRFDSYDVDLTDVKTVNDEHMHAGTPDSINPTAIDQMYTESVRDWDSILGIYTNVTSHLARVHVDEIVERTFAAEKRLPVYAQVNALADRYVTEALTDLKTFVQRKLEAEASTPFTLKKSYQSSYLPDTEKAALKTRRKALYVIDNPADFAKDVPKNFRAANKDVAMTKDDQQNYVMMYAKVQALYNLAAENLVDSVCKDILAILIPKLQKEMVSSIKLTLSIGSGESDEELEVATALVCENPAREKQRQDYEDEKTRLEEAYAYVQQVIANLPTGKGANSSTTNRQIITLDATQRDGTSTSPTRPHSQLSPNSSDNERRKKARIDKQEAAQNTESEDRQVREESLTHRPREASTPHGSPAPFQPTYPSQSPIPTGVTTPIRHESTSPRERFSSRPIYFSPTSPPYYPPAPRRGGDR